MATFDYAGIRDEMQALIAEFGADMTVQRFGDTVDPVAQTVTRVVLQEQTLAAAVIPVNESTIDKLDVRWMTDVLADTSVRFCIMTASGALFVPAVKDEVDFWGGRMQVLGCTPLNVAGIDVIFFIGLRKP